jgi:hypothetical protein
MLGALCLSCLALSAVGCGPDKPKDDENQCSAPAGERGTPECKRWHAALCDWAGRCGTLDQCECVTEQASAITCASEAQATACADSLEAASCSEPPFGCDLSDLADRTVAQAGCEEFITAACALDQRCTGSDPATCATELRVQVDCTRAVGLKPSFETCISELGSLACTATATPKSCEQAILAD